MTPKPMLILTILLILSAAVLGSCQAKTPVSASAAEINLTAADLDSAFSLTAEDTFNPAMPPDVGDYNQRIFASSKATIYARVVIYQDLINSEEVIELHRASLEAELTAGMGENLLGFERAETLKLGQTALTEAIRLNRMEGNFLIWADRNVIFELIAIGRFGAVSRDQLEDLARLTLRRAK